MGKKKNKYAVRLSESERAELNRLTQQGRIEVRKLNRVKILLLADENHSQGQQSDPAIAEKLATGLATVERVRRSYVVEGLSAALAEKPRSGRPPVIDGLARAQITALACSTPPTGHARWSLRLLANKAIELEVLEQISYKTVGEILKKTNCNPSVKCLGVSAS